jgi:LysM repeat protein
LLGSLVLSSLVIFLVSYVALVGLKSGSRAIETDAPGAEPSASTSAAVTAVAPTPTPEPSPTVAATATPQRSYTVQSGDSYAAIAQRFGTTAERLVELNKRTLDSPLHPNDVLLLP